MLYRQNKINWSPLWFSLYYFSLFYIKSFCIRLQYPSNVIISVIFFISLRIFIVSIAPFNMSCFLPLIWCWKLYLLCITEMLPQNYKTLSSFRTKTELSLHELLILSYTLVSTYSLPFSLSNSWHLLSLLYEYIWGKILLMWVENTSEQKGNSKFDKILYSQGSEFFYRYFTFSSWPYWKQIIRFKHFFLILCGYVEGI